MMQNTQLAEWQKEYKELKDIKAALDKKYYFSCDR